jgi:hypothetical protein
METQTNTSLSVWRILLSGLLGAVAWFGAMMVFFGPAQQVLTDPAHQSAKMLAVFFELDPPPMIAVSPLVLPLGCLGLGIIFAFVFAVLWPGVPGKRWWQKGLAFGGLSWLLVFPWFEFYLPWNVLREPLPLVGLELALWLGVKLCTGLALSLVYLFEQRG